MITSLLLAVRVFELVLVVQEQYKQVAVLPRHPHPRVANLSGVGRYFSMGMLTLSQRL